MNESEFAASVSHFRMLVLDRKAAAKVECPERNLVEQLLFEVVPLFSVCGFLPCLSSGKQGLYLCRGFQNFFGRWLG
jgi:hypothetical protein